MCFVVEANSKELIAEEDIQSFKLLSPNSIGNSLHSSEWHYRYVLGELNKEIELKFDHRNAFQRYPSTLTISEGYHSFTQFNGELAANAVRNPRPIMRSIDNRPIYLCVIPKGSKYYINNFNGEYVSSNIIIKERVD